MLRRFSSWITKSGNDKNAVNVESLFVDQRVQDILRKITGLDATKIFRFRQYAGNPERPSYRLMTEEEYEKCQKVVSDRAKNRLQIPPFKNSRSEETRVLSEDPEIAGAENGKMVFFDISPGVKPRDRVVVVRENDGVLRTGTPAERDRLQRTYFPTSDRPVVEPGLFEEPCLSDALNEGKYEFVLDYACWFLEPDDEKYIKVSAATYDHCDKADLHEKLWSTRHYGAMVFYLTINRNVDNLLVALLNKRKLEECADVIHLYGICNPDCKTADTKSSLDLVKNFIKFDAKNKPRLANVLQAYEESMKEETQAQSEKKAMSSVKSS